MLKIDFEYKDELSRGKWNKQTCIVSSIKECVKLYGLDEGGVEYRIVKVEEV